MINASLFDVFSVAMTQFDREFVISRAEKIRELFYELMHNDDFLKSITLSTNSTVRVKSRFEILEEALQVIKNVN